MKMYTTDSCLDFPLVTVITATYNLIKSKRIDYFRQSVESVHNQTYSPIEHLIIDGGSSDGTLALFSEYEEKGWVTVYSEPDKGIYDAFNKGLQKAKGKYIAFLNSDDIWHDSRGVETSVKALEKELADFSYSSIIFLSGTRKKHITPTISSFFYDTPFCHQTMFTRTERLRDVGGFNLRYKVFADRNAIAQLILSGAKAVYVPLCFTTFRDGGFANSYDSKYLRSEIQTIVKSLYSDFATEEEINHVSKKELTATFKEILEHKIHSDIAKELSHYCQWNRWDKLWYYQNLHSWGRIIQPIAYIMNHIIPGWHNKLRRFYRLRRSIRKNG